jgi:hypothetical protein
MSFLFGNNQRGGDENLAYGFGNTSSQQQHPLGTLNKNYTQIIQEEEDRKRREDEEAEAERKRKNAELSPEGTGASTNESPPTSPPRSEAPPPSDDEFTNFVLRRAAKQLGVDFVPGQFSTQNSRNNSPRGAGGKQNSAKDFSVDEKNPFSYHHQGTTSTNNNNHHRHPSPTSGAAHPIDTLKAHHWRDQITVDDVADIPVPRFPSTLKAARRIATVEKRLQEPPPSGLQRFGQFIDCSPEEIARMISLRETSLGETHASVPPLYDVLGDMLLFEGESAQAERYYTTCLQRLELRSTQMQQQEKEDLERLAKGNNAVSRASKLSRFHPSNKSNPNSWLSQATNWSKEVATLNAKLGMLWMNQGKKEASCAAFLRAAELVDPTGFAASFSSGFGGGRGSSIAGNNNNNVRGSSLSPNPSSYRQSSIANEIHNNNVDASSSINGLLLKARPNESLESAHLRQLLTGLPKPVPVKVGGGRRASATAINNNRRARNNSSTNTNGGGVVESDNDGANGAANAGENDEEDQYYDEDYYDPDEPADGIRKRDRGAIANALADRILAGVSGGGGRMNINLNNAKSPTRSIDVQTVLSAPKETDEHFREYIPSRGDSRSQSISNNNNNNIQMLPLGAASTPLQNRANTPVRRPSLPNVVGGGSITNNLNYQNPSNASSPNLHDASSLKNLVDSITQDGRMEDSRRRMRNTLQQSTSPLRAASITSSTAAAGYHHLPLQHNSADTNETLRKTKDLQDIISRIRNRTDLMC